MSENNQLMKAMDNISRFKENLFAGKLSLAKTFWLCWFIPMAFTVLCIALFVESDKTLIKSIALMAVWNGCIFLAIYRIKNANIGWKIAALVLLGLDFLNRVLYVYLEI